MKKTHWEFKTDCISMLNLFRIGEISKVDQLPHLEVPYPIPNGGQQLRHASGRCPVPFIPLHILRQFAT